MAFFSMKLPNPNEAEELKAELSKVCLLLDKAVDERDQLKSDNKKLESQINILERSNRSLDANLQEKQAYIDGYKDAVADYLNSLKGRMAPKSNDPPF